MRRLEQEIAALFRKAAVKVADGEKKVTFREKDLESHARAPRYKNDKPEVMNEPGLSTAGVDFRRRRDAAD